MTTTSKAASNGSTPTRERVTGASRVWESQVYHLASVAHDAAFEAERLCNDISRAASDAYLRDSGRSPAALTADPAMIRKAEEASVCLAAAVAYLADLFSGEPSS